MMKALVVDDERLARLELRRLLRDVPEVEVLGEARNVPEAIETTARLGPDLLFLDVQMPGGSGFDVLDALERVPLVVFTTAHEEHAVRAFEVNALDYLLKPIDPRRLRSAIDRVAGRLASRPAPPDRTWLERIFVKDGDLCLVADVRDIRHLESEGNYTRLHLASGAEPLLARSLGWLEERLDPDAFFRASRREIVSLAEVVRVESAGGNLSVHLRSGRVVEVSRRQGQRLRQRMKT
jgi:two-component system LytT family response regulator